MVLEKENNNLKIFLIIVLVLIILLYIYNNYKKEHLNLFSLGGNMGSISSCIFCFILIGVIIMMLT